MPLGPVADTSTAGENCESEQVSIVKFHFLPALTSSTQLTVGQSELVHVTPGRRPVAVLAMSARMEQVSIRDGWVWFLGLLPHLLVLTGI